MSAPVVDIIETQIIAEQKKRRRKIIVSVITVSIIVHLILGAGATVWIVAKYFTPPPAVFVAPKKEIIIPAEERDHRLNMAEFDGAAPKPSFTDKLSSIRPSPFSLPDLPKVPMDQVLPLDPAQLITEQVSSLFGTGGIGDGTGNGVGGKSGRNFGLDGMSFFGIKDQARSVVIMIDVSGSMFTRTGDAEGGGRGITPIKAGKEQAFQVVRDAALELIQKIGPNTRFGIVRWSGGAYSWKPELVAATDANKTAALDHVQNQIDMNTARPNGGRPGGTRHDYALEEAFKLKPEVIYMLTDGNATEVSGGGLIPIAPDRIWDAAAAGQKNLETPARVHVIYYVTGQEKADEEKMLRVLAGRNQGRFKKVKAKNAGDGNDSRDNRGGRDDRKDNDKRNKDRNNDRRDRNSDGGDRN